MLSKFDIWNQYNNPYYYWWKARKYFKRPKINFMFGREIWFFGLPVRRDYYNRIIDFRLSGLGWKTKYDECRHEWDPYICITFFRTWHLIWIFNWISKKDSTSGTRSMLTWEAILEYVVNKTDIYTIKNSFGAISNGGKITIEPNLKWNALL